jgi:sterol 3beta-glucosyltransferase
LNADWGPKIDVVGFCFLDLASDYVPPEELVKWLEAGDKPIYVGFGSLVSSLTFLYLLHVILSHF